MNKVIINKDFFDLNSVKAEGLISGLKKLSREKFILEVPDYSFSPDNPLTNILHLERINLNSEEKEFENIFEIQADSRIKKNNSLLNSKLVFNNFADAVDFLLTTLRSAVVLRKTKETEIKINLSLDGKGDSEIYTGIGFFDHMLEQIARHANLNLKIKAKGDLDVDEHHTVEDTGLALGEAISKALGIKEGIKRYGFLLPMDDAAAYCAIDLGGRSYLNFKCRFNRNKVGDFPTELTEEFFRALSSGMKANIYIRSKGKNDHHKIESIFKAFAKSLNEACRFDERSAGILPSTKGLL